MALHFDPSGGEPVRDEGRLRTARGGERRQISREGVEQLAHGALVCPACDAPVVLASPVPAGERLACGFCDHDARAHDFVVADVYDTVSNEVYLIARLAS